MMICLSHGKNRSEAQGLNWAALWQMDSDRIATASWSSSDLALSLRVWHRAICSRICSCQGTIQKLWRVRNRRSDGARIRQMDRAQLRPRSIDPNAILDLSLRMWDAESGCRQQLKKREFARLWLRESRLSQGAPNQTRHGEYEAAHGLVHDAPALQQSQEQGLSKLWWSGHQSLRSMAGFCCLLGRYGRDVRRGFKYRAHGQRWQLRAEQLYLGKSIRAIKEQTKIFGMETK